MNVVALSRVATLYSGVIAAGLVFLLMLISRFYQRQANVWSGYLIFLLPAAALLLAAIRYAWEPGQIAGDLGSDLLRFVGGASLFGWGAYLIRLMTGRRL